MRGLDFDSIFSPLNIGDAIEVSTSSLRPLDKPSEKTGFSRSLGDLRGLEGNIWAKIFSKHGPGAKFSFLRNRENDETLTVEKLFVRYFIPTPEYMKEALEVDAVSFYIEATKRKKPLYLITGLMWTEGVKLSKVRSKKTRVTGEGAGIDPTSTTTGGAKAAIENEDNLSSSFDGSTPIILGIRVRKIWWSKDGVAQGAEHIVGATLGDSKKKEMNVLDGLVFVDDEFDNARGQTVVDESLMGEKDPVTWILP